MSHEDPCFSLKVPCENILEDLFLDICIQSRDRIVHQYNISLCVYSSCQRNSGLLPSTQINTFFTNLSLIAGGQNLKISLKLTNLNDMFVPLFIELLAKCNIFSNCLVLNPRNLLNVRNIVRKLNSWKLIEFHRAVVNFLLHFLVLVNLFILELTHEFFWKIKQITDES